VSRVAIVGCGLIGRAWAISFARAGHDVVLWDEQSDAAYAAISYCADILPELAAHQLLNGLAAETVLARISAASKLEHALVGAAHVQENVPEILEIKQTLFARLDEAAEPDAILASSTSALLPSAFTENLKGRARCMVIHPINPPYLIPAAEIVPAPWTDPVFIERARQFMIAAGHAPLVMKREIDGFIMNRMQGAVMEEAFRLVADGYASVEDVDIGLREGLALRWSFMGPFETMDLNAPGGIRDYVQRYQQIYERLHPSQQRRVDWAGPIIDQVERERRQRLPHDKLKSRQVWRDRRLMALAAHKKQASGDIGD
jgi:L-gulonate 3-dehydrogenase